MARIMDHRNNGFTAKDAHYEDVSGRAKSINRQITTKIGLKEYTNDEIIEKCGEVIEYNYNHRYSWKEFNEMPPVNRREYIHYLVNKYDGLRLKDLACMFEKKVEAIKPVIFETKVYFPRGGSRYMSAGRKKFYEDMIPDDPYQEPIIININPKKEDPVEVVSENPDYMLYKTRFSCNASDIQKITDLMNITGKVMVTIEPWRDNYGNR